MTMTVRKALLLCNGEPPSRALVRRAVRRSSLVVAADGGAETARRCGVTPDLIVGDFDSIRPSTRRYFSAVNQRRVRRQDNTDLEKALDELHQSGALHVLLLGATGRRIDFTLGNLSSLWRYDRHLEMRVGGDGWYAVPVRRALRISAPPGTTVSLLPFGPCAGVSLRGFRYPLSDASFRIGRIGVSNVTRTSPAFFRMRRGHMLTVVFDDPLSTW